MTSTKTTTKTDSTKPTHVLVCDWCSFGATFRACVCCGRRKPVAP